MRHLKTSIVTLHGDLGLYDESRVEAMLPAPNEIERLVIDCSHVHSLDSTILALFMKYRRAFQIAGHNPLDIVFIATPRLERLFELTGISRAMTVLPAQATPEENSTT